LPKCLYAILLRLFLAELLNIRIFSTDLANTFSQSAIFVLAILIAGVLEDYKEAETVPASIAACLDDFSEVAELAVVLSAAKGTREGTAGLEGQSLHREVMSILESIFLFLGEMISDREVFASISSHSRLLASRLHMAGFESQGDRVMELAGDLRKLIFRLHVIKRTDFLESGTALMQLLVYITIALSILSDNEDVLEGLSFTGFSALQFFYVMELLSDIDDPFEYSKEKLLPVLREDEDGKKLVMMEGAGQSAEVDLFPILFVLVFRAQLTAIFLYSTL